MSDTPDTKAIEAEAADSGTITVEWTIPERLLPSDPEARKKADKTLTFSIPRDHLDWPLDAELALRSDDPIALAEAFMGDDFASLRALRPTNRDAVDLSRAIIRALGFESAGESAASSD